MDWSAVKPHFDPKKFHRNAEPEVKWIVEHMNWDDTPVLDVGCLDSGLLRLLPKVTAGTIVGVDSRPGEGSVQMDIRWPDFKHKFKVVIFLSTLEHIGLDCYGNSRLDNWGDTAALAATEKILAANGRVLLTAPWDNAGNWRERNGKPWERRYSHDTAFELLGRTKLVAVEYVEDHKNELVMMELKHG